MLVKVERDVATLTASNLSPSELHIRRRVRTSEDVAANQEGIQGTLGDVHYHLATLTCFCFSFFFRLQCGLPGIMTSPE